MHNLNQCAGATCISPAIWQGQVRKDPGQGMEAGKESRILLLPPILPSSASHCCPIPPLPHTVLLPSPDGSLTGLFLSKLLFCFALPSYLTRASLKYFFWTSNWKTVRSVSVEALSVPPCFFKNVSNPFSSGYFLLPIKTTEIKQFILIKETLYTLYYLKILYSQKYW